MRPLVRTASSERTADLSRRHAVTGSASGLISVTGGKLTTYRRMAADTVDQVGRVQGGSRLRGSPTRHLRLRGSAGLESVRGPGAAERLGVEAGLLDHLVRRYGGEARTIVAMLEADPELGRPLLPGYSHVRAAAVYAARYEMAQTLDDVLSRRTRALLFGRDTAAAHALRVARLLAPELGWSPPRVEQEVASFLTLVAKERASAQLPEASDVVP